MMILLKMIKGGFKSFFSSVLKLFFIYLHKTRKTHRKKNGKIKETPCTQGKCL